MAQPLDVGSVIEDRYELVEQLGEGGFAKIFAARQVHLDRLVAIKVLNVSMDAQVDDSFEERFLHEAKMAAQLSHPNVVTIHEFGFAGPLKQPYMAMEMLQGHDLDHELYDGPMLPSRALRLLVPALDALAAGHAKKIVHKDLKPANLFLTNPGSSSELMVVLDYGVARWNLHDSPKFTATGAFTGTPAYLAPEYAREQVVTPAVDVYQMGLIIPEMLTGLPLVMEETPWDCLMVHAEGRVEIPIEVQTSPLGPVIEQALAYDYRERLPDAAALKAALEEIDTEALDQHFRERGLGTVEAVTMDETIPPERYELSDQTHREFVGGTNAAWPPASARRAPSDDQADTEPDPPPRPQASPGTILVPMGDGAQPQSAPDLEPRTPRARPSKQPQDTRYVESDPGEHRGIPIAALLVAGAVILSAAGALYWLSSPTSTEPDPAPESEPEIAAKTPMTFEAKVSSEPSESVITRGGESVGMTPHTVTWSGTESTEVTVSRKGYEPQTVTLSDGRAVTVTLDKRAEVAETKRKPSRKKQREPEKSAKKAESKRSGSDGKSQKKSGQPTFGTAD